VDLTREWSSNRSFGLRQTDAGVGLLEGSTVIGSVATHADLGLHVVLEEFHQVGFVVGRHASVDLGLVKDFEHDRTILLLVGMEEGQSFSIESHSEVLLTIYLPRNLML